VARGRHRAGLSSTNALAPGPEAAARAARRLVALDRVQALVGGFSEAEALALSAIAEETGTPFLNIAATFNARTGTPSARLRKKLQWLQFALYLSEKATVREAAARCRVAIATSFRWRHRLLRAGVADAEALSGIVETDETFFRRSLKGSRCWRTQGDRPPRPSKEGAAPAQKRGLSDQQVAASLPARRWWPMAVTS